MSLENISPEEFDSALASFGLGGIGDLPVAMHPGSSPGGAISKNERGGKPSLPVSDIGRIRENVSVVIGKGKSKEVFGKNLSQAEVEKLDEKHLSSLSLLLLVPSLFRISLSSKTSPLCKNNLTTTT